jgi:hypothetical protein
MPWDSLSISDSVWQCVGEEGGEWEGGGVGGGSRVNIRKSCVFVSLLQYRGKAGWLLRPSAGELNLDCQKHFWIRIRHLINILIFLVGQERQRNYMNNLGEEYCRVSAIYAAGLHHIW